MAQEMQTEVDAILKPTTSLRERALSAWREAEAARTEEEEERIQYEREREEKRLREAISSWLEIDVRDSPVFWISIYGSGDSLLSINAPSLTIEGITLSLLHGTPVCLMFEESQGIWIHLGQAMGWADLGECIDQQRQSEHGANMAQEIKVESDAIPKSQATLTKQELIQLALDQIECESTYVDGNITVYERIRANNFAKAQIYATLALSAPKEKVTVDEKVDALLEACKCLLEGEPFDHLRMGKKAIKKAKAAIAKAERERQ